MSLLGIDVGTTGCKAAVFSETGGQLAFAYEEYDYLKTRPDWAELDVASVWAKIKKTIGQVAAAAPANSIKALAVSSMGEALVPVSADRQILGPSILNFDARGAEYLPHLSRILPNDRLYRINGNTWGNHYSLTKLKWLKQYQPELYRQADKFLLWSSFVSFMLGAEARVDYSLANRTLLFDLDRQAWSDEILRLSNLDQEKLPDLAPTGAVIGVVSGRVADELGLPHGVPIVAGAHDQCANAVGCGVIDQGRAMWGMGTFICATPVFSQRHDSALMIERGLNTEHHAVSGQYVSFIYNQGGSLVKWFRDTFAAAERRQAEQHGGDIYADLFAEIPQKPSPLIVLPPFSTGSVGVMAGLQFDTPRGEILKGIIEGVTFDLKEAIESLPAIGIEIADFRAVGGGSKSDVWLQVCADILGRPFVRPKITEAGALGAAIMAGVGCGVFSSYAAGVEAMVGLERTFEPDMSQHQLYQSRYEEYSKLRSLMKVE